MVFNTYIANFQLDCYLLSLSKQMWTKMDLDGNREIPEVPGTISADRLASESYKHVSM